MDARLEEAIRLSHADIITAAAAKLERKLLLEKRAGIERIGSLMTLESIYRAFSFDKTSASQVAADLQYYASRSS